jgi:ElaB/YqjD/DUF883 family membrane-anchored ribosome-binding protein
MSAIPNTRQALGDSLNLTSRRARRIARTGRHAASDISTDVRALLGELEDALGEGTHADVDVLRAKLRRSLDSARNRFGETRDDVRQRAEAAWADANVYVRERPVQTVAIAAGIVLVLGFLVSRR